MDSGGSVRSRDERDERDAREEADDHSETASATKRQRTSLAGTGQGRGAGYSAAEVSFFLSLLEEHLPVTSREWKAVVRLHNAQFPSLKRSTNSLRRKFLALCRSASGKEEANWSPDVRRAYLARFRMKNRGDIPDDEVDVDSDDDEDHEDDSRGNTGSTAAAQAAQAAQAAMNQQRFYQQQQQQQQQMPGQHELQTMPPPPHAPHPMYNQTNGGMRQPSISERMMEAVEFRGAMPPHASTASEANLMELIKLQLLQNVEEDRRRRTEERERREAERRHWDEERAIRDDYRRRWEEERARREEDLRRWEEDRAESRRRHEEFMQLILSLVNKNK